MEWNKEENKSRKYDLLPLENIIVLVHNETELDKIPEKKYIKGARRRKWNRRNNAIMLQFY